MMSLIMLLPIDFSEALTNLLLWKGLKLKTMMRKYDFQQKL